MNYVKRVISFREKYILLGLFLILIINLSSCTKNEDNQNVMEETVEIIEDFPDTIEGSIKAAEDIVISEEIREEEFAKEIKNIEKY